MVKSILKLGLVCFITSGTCASLAAAEPISASASTSAANAVTQNKITQTSIWITDLDQAKEKAKTENKPLYLLFTGTKWCIWCARMENDVYEKPEFWNAFKDRVVFAMIDVPARRDEKISRLMDTYKILGVPSIVVLSSDGKELGRLGYPSSRDLSLTPVQVHIEQLNKLLPTK